MLGLPGRTLLFHRTLFTASDMGASRVDNMVGLFKG